MKKNHHFKKLRSFFFLGIIIIGLISCNQNKVDFSYEIEAGFKSLPDSIKPWTYWYWISDNISKDGITKDLEGMAEIGIGTALIGNIGLENVSQGDIPVLSEEWWDMMRWAVKEGKRTGVDIGVFNCPGWSQSGGPWITPDKSMRYLTSIEVRATGPSIYKDKLSIPEEDFQDVAVLAFPADSRHNIDFSQVNATIGNPNNIKDAKNLFDGDKNTELIFSNQLNDDEVITFDIELNREITPQSLKIYPAHLPLYANLRLYVFEKGKYKRVKETLINRMNPQIIVGFEPYAPVALALPEISAKKFKVEIEFVTSPRKTILRGGIKEIEFSSTPVVEFYKEKQLAKMKQVPWFNGREYLWPRQAEPVLKNSLLNDDQIIDLSENLNEQGILNWNVPEGEWIIQRIGMTPTQVTNHPTLPHATGFEADKMNEEAIHHHFESYIGKFWESLPDQDKSAFKYVYVDSYETGSQNWTDGLRDDFIESYGYDPIPWLPVLSGEIINSADQSNRFLWDLRRLIADFVSEKYAKGLRDASNAKGLKFGLENVGHWGFPGETLLYGKYPDFQAGEFWNEGILGNWENRIASSTAHIYGKKKVYCESFTAGGLPFKRSPMNLKKRGDWAYTEGVNQTILHLHILQPQDELKPGINAGFGTEFNRHNTWYPQSKSWIDYQRRNNFMLQQGRYVADVCYFYGEDAPKLAGYQNLKLPEGFSYDYINYDVIMHRLDVKEGRFVLPDGMSYRVMVLPDRKTMRPELLERISLLVQKGGVIVGNLPERSPSLKDYPHNDYLVDSIVSELWNEANTSAEGYHAFGKGMVFPKMDLTDVFEVIKLVPDLYIKDNKTINWIHRSLPHMEIYFLSNQSNHEIHLNGTFRVKNMKPEWWNAINGEIRGVPEFTNESEGISLHLRLGPLESGYVVFRNNAMKARSTTNFPMFQSIYRIENKWEVHFKDPFGEQFIKDFNTLSDWTKSEDKQIKYFSGNAVFRTTFHIDSLPVEELYLNLGNVGVMAEIKLNEKQYDALWTAPWRMNITDAIKPGENELEILIVNNWNNRMVGDSGKDADQRKSWASVDIFKPETQLQSSGLLGPVMIEMLRDY